MKIENHRHTESYGHAKKREAHKQKLLSPYCVYARFYMKGEDGKLKTLDLFVELTPNEESVVTLNRLKERWQRTNFLQERVLPTVKAYSRKVTDSNMFILPDYTIDRINNQIMFSADCRISAMYAIPMQANYGDPYGMAEWLATEPQFSMTWHYKCKGGKELFCLLVQGRPDRETLFRIQKNTQEINFLIAKYYSFATAPQDEAFREKMEKLTGWVNNRVIAADWTQAVFEPDAFDKKEMELLMKRDCLFQTEKKAVPL